MTAKIVGKVTAEQMLAEISIAAEADAPPIVDDDAKTINEWGAFFGCTRHKASQRVNLAVKAGLMEHVTRKRPMISGIMRNVPCYRWLGEGIKAPSSPAEKALDLKLHRPWIGKIPPIPPIPPILPTMRKITILAVLFTLAMW